MIFLVCCVRKRPSQFFGALFGVAVVSRSACADWSVVSRTGVWSCIGSVGRGCGDRL